MNVFTKPKPVFKKSRPRCPFYGFGEVMGVFSDTKGNQCPLIISSYSPCQMEFEGDVPNWNRCPLNKGKYSILIKKIMATSKIFPEEFSPPGQSSWKGMPFKKWYKYIMEREPV